MTLYQFECKVKALSRPDSKVYFKIKTSRGEFVYNPMLPFIQMDEKMTCLFITYESKPMKITRNIALNMIRKCKRDYKRYYKNLDELPLYIEVIFKSFNDFEAHYGFNEMSNDIEYYPFYN